MARYIDADAVVKIIDENCPHDKGGYNTEEEMGAGSACYYIRKGVENIPTADVAPRAEVAREIFAEIEKLKHTKWDWNDYVDWDAIAELKKKYMEEKK